MASHAVRQTSGRLGRMRLERLMVFRYRPANVTGMSRGEGPGSMLSSGPIAAVPPNDFGDGLAEASESSPPDSMLKRAEVS